MKIRYHNRSRLPAELEADAVFHNSTEPRLHTRYAELPNTFLLPHIGSATRETRLAMGPQGIGQSLRVLQREPHRKIGSRDGAEKFAIIPAENVDKARF